ncbi:glycosyltransferase family 2 protein [bacterium]|nr:glycosyltransferase family 2 protein [bacterium]
MSEENVKVSIVIACYNESTILEESLNTIIRLMQYSKFEYEVILVDDKSRDDSLSICRKFVDKYPFFKLITHEKNRGRGKTVTDGIHASNNNIVAFIDIDLETPAHYLIPLFELINNGADVAIAERIYKVKVHSLHRWITSKGYMFLVKLYCRTPLLDTESGCKAFNKENILPVLAEIKDERWFWDTEIVVRSHYKNLKIKQFPTLFIRKREVLSTVKLFRDSIRQYIKLVKFRKELSHKYFKAT